MAKIAVFYYTQTGQTLEIAKSICCPLVEAGNELIYKEIVPVQPFPFTWSAKSFFQVFPESRLGIPTAINALDFRDIQDVDLVVVAFQVWFLSPSLPVHAFFQNEEVKNYLSGKQIVTIDGCRNMWVMAQQKIGEYIAEAGAQQVGNIVLQDRYPNLVSVLTIVRWLMGGQKSASKILPAAGVSDKDIASASRFGEIILEAIKKENFSNLQENLMNANAIRYKASLSFIERNGHRLFGIWANFVRKKGGYNDEARGCRLLLFEYYLYAVLFLVSPIGLVVFYLTYPFRIRKINKEIRKYCYLQNE